MHFYRAERSFREQLVAMESQLMSLQASHEELGAHRKSGERRERENVELKSIISSQDERVSGAIYSSSHMGTIYSSVFLGKNINRPL